MTNHVRIASAARGICLATSTAVLASGLVLAGPATAATAAPSRTGASRCEGPSDAEIFHAVFFGKGPAATRLPKAYVDARAKFLAAEKEVAPRTRLRALERSRARLVRDGKTADARLVEQAITYYERLADRRTAGDASDEQGHVAFLRAFEQRHPGALATFAKRMRSGDPAAVRAAMRSMVDKAMGVALAFGQMPTAGDEPYPEEDSNIAVVGLTFIVLFVLVAIAFPLTAEGNDPLREDEIAGLMATAFACPAR